MPAACADHAAPALPSALYAEPPSIDPPSLPAYSRSLSSWRAQSRSPSADTPFSPFLPGHPSWPFLCCPRPRTGLDRRPSHVVSDAPRTSRYIVLTPFSFADCARPGGHTADCRSIRFGGTQHCSLRMGGTRREEQDGGRIPKLDTDVGSSSGGEQASVGEEGSNTLEL